MNRRSLFLVFGGGALGSLVRAGVLSEPVGQQAAALVVLNVVGSFILGVAVVRLAASPGSLAGVGVGFCGGLTSLSTFAVDIAHRIDNDSFGSAAALLLVTCIGAVAAAALGKRTGESL